MPLVTDTNIYIGSGTTSTSDAHSFTKDGLKLELGNSLLVEDVDLRFALPMTLHFHGELKNAGTSGRIYVGDLQGIMFLKDSSSGNVSLSYRDGSNFHTSVVIPNSSNLGIAKLAAVLTTGSIKVYKNGVEVFSANTTVSTSTAAQNFGVGTNATAGTYVLSKDLRVWAQALTPQQVSTL
jgi:hypothetical protein